MNTFYDTQSIVTAIALGFLSVSIMIVVIGSMIRYEIGRIANALENAAGEDEQAAMEK